MNNVGKDILLADDDDDDVYLFTSALGDINAAHKLSIARDCQQLFTRLKDAKPHIIFLDYYLPPDNGLSCIVQIRQDHVYDAVPVIVHSTLLSDKVARECIKSGATDYMQKDPNYKEMVGNIRSMLDLHCK